MILIMQSLMLLSEWWFSMENIDWRCRIQKSYL